VEKVSRLGAEDGERLGSYKGMVYITWSTEKDAIHHSKGKGLQFEIERSNFRWRGASTRK